MRLATTLPAALAASILLAASSADASSPTGKVRTWQAATQGRSAMHGAMSWTVDKNPGDVSVSMWLQRYQKHGWGVFSYHSWDRRGPAPAQDTTTGTSGGLTTHAKCLTGRWRVHVDVMTIVETRGVVPTAYPIHRTYNSRQIVVRSC